jgi:hypothetical protein
MCLLPNIVNLSHFMSEFDKKFTSFTFAVLNNFNILKEIPEDS